MKREIFELRSLAKLCKEDELKEYSEWLGEHADA